MRISLSAAMLSALYAGLLGCSKSSGGVPDAGPSTCQVSIDCPALKDGDGGSRAQVCISQICVPTCANAGQCTSGQVCEDGICAPPACGTAGECGPGQLCSGGTCQTAPVASDVASCSIAPGYAVVSQGKAVQLAAVVKNAAGAAIPFTATWSATGAGSVSAAGLVTSSAAGDIDVTANAGGKTCAGKVVAYAANTTAGTVRVVVINQFDKKPVAGATVVLDTTATKTTTDAQGVASFAGVAAGAHSAHVFADGYDYVSIVNTTNIDILAPLFPYSETTNRSGFAGRLLPKCPQSNPNCGEQTFADLAVQGEALHLAFFGSAIPSSPIDIGITTLIGQLRPVAITLAGRTINVDLPSGLVIGVQDTMFDTEKYTIYSEAGMSALWGLGGNLNLTAVLQALSPILQGGTTNIDAGALLAQLLPLVGKLQAGQIVGTTPPPNATPPTFTSLSVPLNTALRLRTTLKLPDLPKQDGEFLGAAAAIGGLRAYPIGFVPTGLTAGLSATDTAGKNTAKTVDPTCDPAAANCATSKLPMRLAPGNNGLQGAPWSFSILAANLAGLSLGGTGGGSNSVSLSALIKNVDQITYVAPPGDGQVIDLTGRGFMALPASTATTLTRTSRTVAIPADADPTTKFYRVGVENKASLNWNLYLPSNGAAQNIVLPNPADVGKTDPMADPNATALLLATSLTGGATFNDVAGFGAVTLDQLHSSIDAFTLVTVKIQ